MYFKLRIGKTSRSERNKLWNVNERWPQRSSSCGFFLRKLFGRRHQSVYISGNWVPQTTCHHPLLRWKSRKEGKTISADGSFRMFRIKLKPQRDSTDPFNLLLIRQMLHSTYTLSLWWKSTGRRWRPRRTARRRKLPPRRRTSGPSAKSSSSRAGTWCVWSESRAPELLRNPNTPSKRNRKITVDASMLHLFSENKENLGNQAVFINMVTFVFVFTEAVPFLQFRFPVWLYKNDKMMTRFIWNVLNTQ